jgi:FRG domain
LQILQVKRWSELQNVLADGFCGNQWIFRGQRNSSWPLQTRIQRVCRDFESAKYRGAEIHLLHQFQRRLHHYRLDVPAHDDTLEWFALMQHYGAPTRLLDWTRSPYVAAYFAIEECSIESPCSIWVVNIESLRNDVLDKHPSLFEAIIGTEAESETRTIGDKELFKKFVLDNTGQGVLPVEPFRMNERMAVQQGLFLVPISIEHSFLDNMKGTTGEENAQKPSLWRIDISLDRSARLNCLEELRKVNIHRGSLFPGIDGFAQSLTTEIEIWGRKVQ